MSAPEVVVLDTRAALDKAGFLDAAGRCLEFPPYSGANWDAFEESLRDFVGQRRPVLVVWTGSSALPPVDRQTALEIMGDAFTDGADLLIVDDLTTVPQPDFAMDGVRVPIPIDALAKARQFWTAVVGLTEEEDGVFGADALRLTVVPTSQFQPTTVAPAVIMVRDVEELQTRLEDAGARIDPLADNNGQSVQFDTYDPFGNAVRFVAF